MSLAYAAPSQFFPWEPESTIRANLAIGELRQMLLKRGHGNAAHAATLLSAAGAMVGFAAQNAALEQGELLSQRRGLVAAMVLPHLLRYVGERLASGLGGLSWTTLYVTLIVLYVVIHYLFVSQTSQVLALFGVFLDVGTRGGVPLPLMSFGLLFASSYFSVITPQGGSQNIIFAASGYLTQRELYKLGLIITLAFLAIYLLIGSPWVYFVMR